MVDQVARKITRADKHIEKDKEENTETWLLSLCYFVYLIGKP
jgi:hypothetical protein